MQFANLNLAGVQTQGGNFIQPGAYKCLILNAKDEATQSGKVYTKYHVKVLEGPSVNTEFDVFLWGGEDAASGIKTFLLSIGTPPAALETIVPMFDSLQMVNATTHVHVTPPKQGEKYQGRWFITPDRYKELLTNPAPVAPVASKVAAPSPVMNVPTPFNPPQINGGTLGNLNSFFAK